MIITLDGPSGSGKSTLAKLLAQKLNFFYLNSGYLYRSLAYILVAHFHYNEDKLKNPEWDDVKTIFHENNFEYRYKNGSVHVFFKEKDITSFLKDIDVSKNASLIALHPFCRKVIVPFQQKYGKEHDLVTDGRDGGTAIYPDAQFKFYVIADTKIRAQRLQSDQEKKGKFINIDEAIEMVESRDHRDMTRPVAPLIQPENAIIIDTSKIVIEDSLDFIFNIIQK